MKPQLLSERDRLHKELEAQSEKVKELQFEVESYYNQRDSPRNIRK